MSNYENQYLDLLKKIKKEGVRSSNRTGIDTLKIWGAQMHIDLSEGFPLLTTKKMHWKSVVYELLWMIKGDTNIQYLLKNSVTFWSEWPWQHYSNAHSVNHAVDNNKWMRKNEDGSFSIHTLKEFEKRIIEDDEFAKKWGSIGELGYGGVFRRFPCMEDHSKSWEDENGRNGYVEFRKGQVDQLTNVLNDLKTNPDSRRIIISAWHPYHSNRKEDALLPACHNYIQFGTEELTVEERWERNKKMIHCHTDEAKISFCDRIGIPKYRLNCYYSMRSNDFFLGLPFNNAFYALFTHLIANELNMIPNKLVYSAADVHLYSNHLEQVDLQLARTPKKLPKLKIKTPNKSIFDITFEDVELIGYDPHPAIKADVAI